MKLTPRYGQDPIIRIEGFVGDPFALVAQQRTRFAEELARLDDSQWRSPSRCEGWSVQDVLTHLVTTNQFWAFSIGAGLAGKPSTFLTDFDPVASPAQIVAAADDLAPADTLAAFVASNESLAAAGAAVGDNAWTAIGEAPPGHVSMGCIALHALWDSLIHERDVLLPLGRVPAHEPDELAAGLTYAAALGPGFVASQGSTRVGSVAVRATDPDVQLGVKVDRSVVVTVNGSSDDRPDDTATVEGDCTALLEALSCRSPLASVVAAEHQWMFEGLVTVFDQPSATQA